MMFFFDTNEKVLESPFSLLLVLFFLAIASGHQLSAQQSDAAFLFSKNDASVQSSFAVNIESFYGSQSSANAPHLEVDNDSPFDFNSSNLEDEKNILYGSGLNDEDNGNSLVYIPVYELVATPEFESANSAVVEEGTTIATTVLDVNANDGACGATDANVTYSLSGTDVADFSINTNTGLLTFAVLSSWSSPADANTDNIYELTVTANNGNAIATQDLKIYVFPKNGLTGSEITQQLGLDIDGEAAGDYSGRSVSLSADGKTVAIGAHQNDGNGANSGQVRIYSYNGAAWAQLGADIDGEAADDESGRSVSLSADGKTVAIGAWGNDGNGNASGHVRIYSYNGAAWVQLGADIDGEVAGDQSGFSVSLSADGKTVAMGANSNDGNGLNSGHVRIYGYNGAAWVQLGGDIDGEAVSDNSGFSVSLSADGKTVAIGATFNDGNGADSGHARIYGYNGAAWVQLGGDIDGESAGDYSGRSVRLSADGKTVAIGANYNGDNGANSGHVRVYGYNGSTWVQLGGDIDGEAADDQSGSSVSLSDDGKTVAIGAWGNDGNGDTSGHVRIYKYNGSAWVQVGADIDGEAEGDQSGRLDQSVSLSADGKTVAIGAYLNAGNGANSGHVRVYALSPVVTNVTSTAANGNFKVGDVIPITITFDKAVTVTGTPQLTLETGATDRKADYASGSGTATLTFNYTVQAGDVTTDLDYVATTSLELNSGTIKDGADIAAILTLASPAEAKSLGANKALVVDGNVPVAPSIATISTDSGADGSDEVTNDKTLSFNGTAEVNSTVEVFIGGASIGTTTADGSGNFSYDHSGTILADGTYSVTAKAKDAAGNESVASTALSVTVDTTAPAAPAVSAITADSGADGSDEVTNDKTLSFNGTAEANSTVEVFIGGTSIGTTTADGSGNFSYDHSGTILADGTYSVTAKSKDAAGNESVASTALSVTVDTTAPAAPAVTSISSDSGVDSTDKITNDTTLKFNGTAEANSVVEILIGGVSIGSTSANGEGYFSFDHTGVILTDGTFSVSAKAKDTAGNVSAASTAVGVTVDTTAPAAPTVSRITTDSGANVTDKITNDNTLQFDGAATPSSMVELFIDGTSIGTTNTKGAGNFSFDHSGTTLADGTYSITAKATDTAGNVSTVSIVLSVTVDTKLAVPTLSSTSASKVKGKFTVTITYDGPVIDFALEDLIITNGTTTNFAIVTTNKVWTVDVIPTAAGTVTVALAASTATDLAGNANQAATDLVREFDNTAPDVVSVSRTDALQIPAGTTTANFRVLFSEAVTGVALTDFELVLTGTVTGSLNTITMIDAKTYDISVNSIEGQGAFFLRVKGDGSIVDQANNPMSTTFSSGTYSTNYVATELVVEPSNISENNAVNAEVGVISNNDADGDIHTYTLVSGMGDTDNASFTISGDKLLATEVFDFEAKSSYNIRIHTDDGFGGIFEKVFTITIINVAEPQIRITSNIDIPETALGLTSNFEITIHNDGEAELIVNSVSLPEGFIGGGAEVNINAGESKTITLGFKPMEVKAYTGVIQFISNAGNVSVDIAGDGAIITGFDDGNIIAEAISIFPNPTSKVLNIDLSELGAIKLNIDIIDASGLSLFNKKSFTEQTLQLDVSGYTSGIYIIQFSDGKSVVRKKVMIKK